MCQSYSVKLIEFSFPVCRSHPSKNRLLADYKVTMGVTIKVGFKTNFASVVPKCGSLLLNSAMPNVEFEVVEVENPDALNLIFGQSHFIKTVEDLYEVIK
jgi:hypothetical protein